MNKNIIIGVGVVGLVVIGGAFAFKKQKPSLEKAMIEVSEPEQENSALGEIKGTLKDLFAKGQSMECTYSQSYEGMITAGKIYVANSKVRADFEINQPGGEKNTSAMIQDGEYVYIWSSASDQGTKFKIDEGMGKDQAEGIEEGSVDMDWQDMNIDYSCKPWREDPSYFIAPTQVKFVDMGAQVEQMMENQCAACEQLPDGEAKSQCLESLDCN